jgi:hypothetical protein
MTTISRDQPCLYITTVARDRLPVFRTDAMKDVACSYIHLNPVRAGLAARAEDYRWSSARCWLRREADDEPLRMDLEKIVWRRPS